MGIQGKGKNHLVHRQHFQHPGQLIHSSQNRLVTLRFNIIPRMEIIQKADGFISQLRVLHQVVIKSFTQRTGS
ncbi:hypothetical protein D3C73_689000 [compost metagenome]